MQSNRGAGFRISVAAAILILLMLASGSDPSQSVAYAAPYPPPWHGAACRTHVIGYVGRWTPRPARRIAWRRNRNASSERR